MIDAIQKQPTPGPWTQKPHFPGEKADGVYSPTGLVADVMTEADARLIAASLEMLAALKGACGYLLNAKIDLETNAPRRTAINTIEGGLRVVREAIAKATGETP